MSHTTGVTLFKHLLNLYIFGGTLFWHTCSLLHLYSSYVRQVMQPWWCSERGDKFGMEEREPADLKLRSFLDLLWPLRPQL